MEQFLSHVLGLSPFWAYYASLFIVAFWGYRYLSSCLVAHITHLYNLTLDSNNLLGYTHKRVVRTSTDLVPLSVPFLTGRNIPEDLIIPLKHFARANVLIAAYFGLLWVVFSCRAFLHGFLDLEIHKALDFFFVFDLVFCLSWSAYYLTFWLLGGVPSLILWRVRLGYSGRKSLLGVIRPRIHLDAFRRIVVFVYTWNNQFKGFVYLFYGLPLLIFLLRSVFAVLSVF